MARNQLFSVLFACIIALVGCDNSDGDETEITNACLVPPDDFDGDGIDDEVDNCLIIKNADQKDSNGDGVGDACEYADDSDAADDGEILLTRKETAGC
jgi:hypothetical protein